MMTGITTMKHYIKPHYTLSSKGFSLIELMIAAALGLVIIAALLTAFIATKRLNTTTVAAADIQETTRDLTEYFNLKIRIAGFDGISLKQSSNRTITMRGPELTTLPNNSLFFDPNTTPSNGQLQKLPAAVSGFTFKTNASGVLQPSTFAKTGNIANANDFQPVLAAELAAIIQRANRARPAPNSDILVLRYLRPAGNARISATNSAFNPSITLDSGPSFGRSLLLLERPIAETADLFFNNSTGNACTNSNLLTYQGAENLTQPWSTDFGKDAHLYYYHVQAYYVSTSDQSVGFPSLHTFSFNYFTAACDASKVWTDNGSYLTIANGVTSMQLRYRLNTTGNFVTGDQVKNWHAVDAVEMNFLLQSQHESGQITTQDFTPFPNRTLRIVKSPYLHRLVRNVVILRNQL